MATTANNLSIAIAAAPGSDEAIKAQRGVQVARGNTAYTDVDRGETRTLSAWLDEGSFRPTREEIELQTDQIKGYLNDERIPVIVPMREPDPQPVAEANLAYLTRFVAPDRITVIWDESSKEALQSVRQFPGVRPVEPENDPP